jgi:hypothetical protein
VVDRWLLIADVLFLVLHLFLYSLRLCRASIICLFIVVIVLEIVLFLAAAEFMQKTNLQNIEIRDLSYIVYYTQVVLDVCADL